MRRLFVKLLYEDKCLGLCVASLMLLFAISCSKSEMMDEVPEEYRLSFVEDTVDVGYLERGRGVLLGLDEDTLDMSWSVISGEEFITLLEDGTFVGRREGYARVALHCGQMAGILHVNVHDTPYRPVESLSLFVNGVQAGDYVEINDLQDIDIYVEGHFPEDASFISISSISCKNDNCSWNSFVDSDVNGGAEAFDGTSFKYVEGVPSRFDNLGMPDDVTGYPDTVSRYSFAVELNLFPTDITPTSYDYDVMERAGFERGVLKRVQKIDFVVRLNRMVCAGLHNEMVHLSRCRNSQIFISRGESLNLGATCNALKGFNTVVWGKGNIAGSPIGYEFDGTYVASGTEDNSKGALHISPEGLLSLNSSFRPTSISDGNVLLCTVQAVFMPSFLDVWKSVDFTKWNGLTTNNVMQRLSGSPYNFCNFDVYLNNEPNY